VRSRDGSYAASPPPPHALRLSDFLPLAFPFPALPCSAFRNPGPIQFDEIARTQRPLTLQAQDRGYFERLEELRTMLTELTEVCRPGMTETALTVALTQTGSLIHTLAALGSTSETRVLPTMGNRVIM
jgi:hypothetical protein